MSSSVIDLAGPDDPPARKRRRSDSDDDVIDLCGAESAAPRGAEPGAPFVFSIDLTGDDDPDAASVADVKPKPEGIAALADALQRTFDLTLDDDDDGDGDAAGASAAGAADILAAERRHIHRWLREGAARVLRDYKLVENEHARPGRPLYERFARCWRAAADKRVRLVFHGTPEHNVENICRTGLDPARRSGQAHGRGEYFGGDAAVSLGYCQGGCKMLVFAVMLDASGLTADLRQHNIVVINKPEHQLPLFVLGFENPQRAAQEAARAAAAAAAARQRKVARRRRAQQQSFVSALARGIQARAGNGR